MSIYFPPRSSWGRLDPADAGFDAELLQEALRFGAESEIPQGRDLSVMIPKGQRHPFDRQLGPLQERGAAAGLIIRHGYEVASFGDPARVDVTFSASKSYISAVAGLAFDQGLLTGLDEPVGKLIHDGGFDDDHNARITWRHLLQQTSEWEGELFGIPDWIDRGRQVATTAELPVNEDKATIGSSAAASVEVRSLLAPGDFWEYNDVRVNRAALSLLRLFQRSLPEVLENQLMSRIDASNTWEWHGYENSWVEVNGQSIQSVSGGAHWGGGVWINSYDHARFGLLYLREGRWQDQQILSKGWITETLTPSDLNPDYGLLWWLNGQNSICANASAESFAARGAGGNIVFVEPALDLVIVLRWSDNPSAVVERIISAIR